MRTGKRIHRGVRQRSREHFLRKETRYFQFKYRQFGEGGHYRSSPLPEQVRVQGLAADPFQERGAKRGSPMLRSGKKPSRRIAGCRRPQSYVRESRRKTSEDLRGLDEKIPFHREGFRFRPRNRLFDRHAEHVPVLYDRVLQKIKKDGLDRRLCGRRDQTRLSVLYDQLEFRVLVVADLRRRDHVPEKSLLRHAAAV